MANITVTGGNGRDSLFGGTNLIVNGSFETQDGTNNSRDYVIANAGNYNGEYYSFPATLYGWTLDSGSPANTFELDTNNTRPEFDATDGAVVVQLTTAGAGQEISMYQDVSGLTAGATYRLSFDTAAFDRLYGETTSAVRVYWNGTLVATVAPESIRMAATSLDLVAGNGANRLTFTEFGGGGDGSGTHLDNVRLFAATDHSATVDYSAEAGGHGVVVKLDNVVAAPAGIGPINYVPTPTASLDAVTVGLTTVMPGRALDTFGDSSLDTAANTTHFDSLSGIANVVGTAQADVIVGNADANRIDGGNGDNRLDGQAGNDVLLAGTGTDTLIGGDGNDTLTGGAGADTLIGGRDYIVNGSFETQDGANVSREFINEAASSFAGEHYRLTTTIEGWTIASGSTNVEFDTPDSVASAFPLNDGATWLDMSTDFPNNRPVLTQTVAGLTAGAAYQLSFDTQIPTGEQGVLEVVWNGTVIDTVTSTSTATTHVYNLIATTGDNTVSFREVGVDQHGNASGTRLDGVHLYATTAAGNTTGTDTVDYSQETGSNGVIVDLNTGTATDSFGNTDTLLGIANATGTSHSDTFISGVEANAITGGLGTDTVSYAVSTAAVTVNLATGVNTGGFAAGDVLTSIENVVGSNLGDSLTGDTNANTFIGGQGNDTIDGGAGIDTAVFTGDFADYTITRAAVASTPGGLITLQIADNTPNRDGTDTVANTEFFSFNGVTYSYADIVNDAPTITVPMSGSVTVTEDVYSPLTGISFGDVDAGTGSEFVTLSLSSGTLSAGGGVSGITIGGSSGVMTLTGTIANLNAYIAGGNVHYLTAPNANGSVTLGVAIDDQGNTGVDPGASGTTASEATETTVTLTITPVNDAPTATNLTQSLTLAEDAAVNLFTTAPTVSDVDSASITATLTLSDTNAGVLVGAGAASSGVYTITGTPAAVSTALAAVTFDPAQDFNGTASVAVAIDDGENGPQGSPNPSGAVSITVTSVNDAPVPVNDTLSTIAEDDGAQTIAFSTLTGNDTPGPVTATDEAGQTLTITDVANAVGGTVAISGTDVIFIPTANFNGTAGFDYTVQDNGTTDGGADPKSATGHASFTITPVNDAPVATNLTQSLTLAEDAAAVKLFTTAPTVSDVDSTSVTATLTLSDTSAGVLVGAGTASNGVYTLIGTPAAVSSALAAVTFDSAQDFNGTASVAVAIDDGANGPQGTNPSGTVSITVTSVNDAPAPVADTLSSIAEDSGVRSIAFTALTGNDTAGPTTATDESGQTLTLTGVSAAVGGTVAIVSGHIEFTPTANFNGTAGFDYTVQDNGTTNGVADPKSANGRASFTITPVQDAFNDTLTTNQDTAGSANVLANDSFGPGAAVSSVTQGTHGAVTIGAGGNVTYTPAAGYHGTDAFTYTAGTTGGTPETATVAVTVIDNVPPNAPAITAIVDHSGHFDIVGSAEANSAIAVSDSNGAVANFAASTNGSGQYDAVSTSPLVNGSHTFTLTATDAASNTSNATIAHVVVQTANALAFSDASFTIGEDSALSRLVLDGNGLTGTANSHGNEIHSIETSASGAFNTLVGGAGTDLLVGGIAADHLQGGGGNDLYAVYNSGTQISDSSGFDIAYAYGVNYALADNDGVDALITVGTGLTGTGHASTANNLHSLETSASDVNTLIGGSAADLLVGGIGADHLQGGAGNDVYALYNSATQISDTSGFDLAYVYGVNYALAPADGVDALLMVGSGLTGTGHTSTATTLYSLETATSDANTLIGGSAADVLVGGIGADHLQGGAGDDVYAVYNSATVINDTSGNDLAYAYVNYQIADGSGIDALIVSGNGLSGTGSSGKDVLYSIGTGNTLNGGSAGNDSFVFDTATTSGNTITGFEAHGSSASGDAIVLQHFVDSTFAAAEANHHIYQSGADVLVADDTHTIVTLNNIQLASLHANDFFFA